MSVSATQLTLRLSPQDIFRLDNFWFANAEQSRALQAFCQPDGLDFIYLWGDSGVGKTHLLIAAVEALQAQGRRVMYLAFTDLLQHSSPSVLQSLEQADLICMDDLQAIAGHKAWEEAVFHCFNRLHDAGGKLLVACDNNPAHSALQLPDLRSRLATALIYQLSALDDSGKQQALILQAQSRGLILPEEVAQYLLRHHGRDMPALIRVLKQLDKASLEAQRRLTIPFVRQVLADG